MVVLLGYPLFLIVVIFFHTIFSFKTLPQRWINRMALCASSFHAGESVHQLSTQLERWMVVLSQYPSVLIFAILFHTFFSSRLCPSDTFIAWNFAGEVFLQNKSTRNLMFSQGPWSKLFLCFSHLCNLYGIPANSFSLLYYRRNNGRHNQRSSGP